MSAWFGLMPGPTPPFFSPAIASCSRVLVQNASLPNVSERKICASHDHLAGVLLDPAIGLVGGGLDRLGGAAEENGGGGQHGEREANAG